MLVLKRFLYHSDWMLTAAVLLTVGIGLIAVWSFAPQASRLFEKQLLWALAGLAVFFTLALIDYRLFRNHGGLLLSLYVVTIFLLGALFLVAPTTRGVVGWFQVLGLGIQPVEPVKLALALVLAKYFSRRHIEIGRLRNLLISVTYAAIPIALVLMQPDLGSALIIGALWFAVVVFSGIRARHFAAFLLLGLALSLFAWGSLLAPYQKARLVAFLDPYRDPQGAGYQTIQAMIAAGSGGLLGKGIGYGSQSHLNFLPEPETDFIFAAFTEETGLVGAALLLAIYGVLYWRMLKIGFGAKDNFSKLFCLGFTSFVFAEFAIHIAMNLGLLPVTGIGLPLVSYGGSNLITTLAGLGILQSIRIHSQPETG